MASDTEMPDRRHSISSISERSELVSEPGKEAKGKRAFKACLNTFRLYFSTLILFACVLGYTLIGAAIFQAIEAPNEQKEKALISKARDKFLHTLLTNAMNDSYYVDEWMTVAQKEAVQFEDLLLKAFKHGIVERANATAPARWTFMGSVVYCVTVHTTIGYGNITPSTNIAQILTILYALLGIPMMLTFLNKLGKILMGLIKPVWMLVDLIMFGQTESEGKIPISFALFILAGYMFAGAAAYTEWEGWSYLGSVYFIFISLSTIGFGDYWPHNKVSLYFSAGYILVGLALLSMLVNVIMDALADSWTTNTEKVKQKIKDKKSKLRGEQGLGAEDSVSIFSVFTGKVTPKGSAKNSPRVDKRKPSSITMLTGMTGDSDYRSMAESEIGGPSGDASQQNEENAERGQGSG